jgi:hypothetical protein
VYLNHVSCEDEDVEDIARTKSNPTLNRDQNKTLRKEIELEFRKSQWFTRSWTIQELIGPSIAYFVGSDWCGVLGSKTSLQALISDITGIDRPLLKHSTRLDEFSIAQKMSWAARRVYTRQEDIAYCLLGIFKVNMPLLHGEGGLAF